MKMLHKKYMKSHYKLDFYFTENCRGSKIKRIKRALKKKVKRELINDLNK